MAPIAGRVSGTILSKVADLAEAAGSDRIRFTPYQKLVILDVARRQARASLTRLASTHSGYPRKPSHWRRNLMACTGIEFCKLSFAETSKPQLRLLAPELEQRLEDINAQLDVPVTININGCPNSCARIQVADIGFKGQMVERRGRRGPNRGLPGAPWRQPRPGQQFWPQTAPAQGDQSTELGDYIEQGRS